MRSAPLACPRWLFATVALACVTAGACAALLLDGHLFPSGRVLGFDFSYHWSAGVLALSGPSGVLYDYDAFQRAYLALFPSVPDPLHWPYPPMRSPSSRCSLRSPTLRARGVVGGRRCALPLGASGRARSARPRSGHCGVRALRPDGAVRGGGVRGRARVARPAPGARGCGALARHDEAPARVAPSRCPAPRRGLARVRGVRARHRGLDRSQRPPVRSGALARLARAQRPGCAGLDGDRCRALPRPRCERLHVGPHPRPPLAAAYAVQGAFAVLAFWAVWRVAPLCRRDARAHAVVALAALLATPYVHVYDLTLSGVALATVAGGPRGRARGGACAGVVAALGASAADGAGGPCRGPLRAVRAGVRAFACPSRDRCRARNTQRDASVKLTSALAAQLASRARTGARSSAATCAVRAR